MNIIATSIQCLMLVGLLLKSSQPVYGQDTNMEQFRWFELERRSEGTDVPEVTPYAENRWGRFVENLDELEKFGAEDWSVQSDLDSGEQFQRDLEERSKNLERVAGQIRELFQWYFNAPEPEIEAIPEEDLNGRLERIGSKVDQVIPLVIAAVNREAPLDVEAFPRMMQGLAEIEVLSKALRN